MLRKKLLMLTPLVALSLTGCVNNQTKQSKNTVQSSEVNQNLNNDNPINKSDTPDLVQAKNEDKGQWLHQDGNNIVKAILKTNGDARKAYAQGFSDGDDNGNYQWANRQQSTNASNAIDTSDITNGIIRTEQMNNYYYQLGWLLSSAQGSSAQSNGSYRGAQSAIRYNKAWSNYQKGQQFIKQHNESKYAAFDDGVGQWFNHNSAKVVNHDFS